MGRAGPGNTYTVMACLDPPRGADSDISHVEDKQIILTLHILNLNTSKKHQIVIQHIIEY